MASTRLNDILNNREDNYLLPFYWQHGNHTERIPEQIERIRKSGCRALCVESRPHPQFGEAEWWRDMDIIMSECRKRDMKVWILDDKHFPTGYANGLVNSKYPECRAWELTERHVDVIGPKPNASILINPDSQDNKLLGVYAVKRPNHSEEIRPDEGCIDLNSKIANGFVYIDIPDGCWRIFFIYKSHAGSKDNYIDMISPTSSKLMIEAVYQPHFEHYAEYFGNTLAGFFSDEPEFGNTYFATHPTDYGFYDNRVGQPGLALPWSDEVLPRMEAELNRKISISELGILWFPSEKHIQGELRLAYMNAITTLYRDNFCRPVGDWCRAHGVEYIGHIIEDMNNHARLCHGAGHYFRSLDGQDMSGIDIVLHQVTPGMAGYISTATCSGGIVDPDFFHYILGQLGCSLADFNPKMKGRAMCEVFGAYGWGEGTPTMKWLMDFLLVRGINRFVPHAFSPDYPDPDCPPHFGAEGHDPQFDGFTALMNYTNKATHLLSDGIHQTDTALLYHAEAEWMNDRDGYVMMQEYAKKMLDNHISYGIVWEDILDNITVVDGKMTVNNHSFNLLVVPEMNMISIQTAEKLDKIARMGGKLVFINALPENCSDGLVVDDNKLTDYIFEAKFNSIAVDGSCPLLRIFHTKRNSEQIFMLFNESPAACNAKVKLPAQGQYACLSLLRDRNFKAFTSDGNISVNLAAGESEILIFGDKTTDLLPDETVFGEFEQMEPIYTVELAGSENLAEFKAYTKTNKLFDVNSPEHIPGFSGKIKYTFEIDLPEKFENVAIDFGQVGENVRLSVNGQDAGIMITAPYTFDVTKYVKSGKNTLTATASNTLANKVRDGFSFNLALLPSGIMGPVKLAIK